jgi:hypothetical protein
MQVYRFNDYTQTYFKYNIFEYDEKAHMFDESLHNNDFTPGYFHPRICIYCGAEFDSRNQLFKHLGFMNIDIRKSNGIGLSLYDAEMGDFGMSLDIPKLKRTRRHRRYDYYRITKRHRRRKNKKKGTALDPITNLMKNIKL